MKIKIELVLDLPITTVDDLSQASRVIRSFKYDLNEAKGDIRRFEVKVVEDAVACTGFPGLGMMVQRVIKGLEV